MTSKILVPVDFSDASRVATDSAVPIARAVGADIELLHVTPDVAPAYHGLAAPDFTRMGELHAELIAQSRETIAQLCSEVKGESGVHVTSHVTSGQPIPEIVGRADQIAAGMIVVATHGRTGFDHFLMGSVCERILRAAHCPVYVARPSKSGSAPRIQIQRILVAVDGSEPSGRALAMGRDLAQSLGADLQVVHVWERPNFVRGGRPDAELVERLEKNARDRLAVFMKSANLPAGSIEDPQVIVGAPAVAIIGHVNESPPDLIVMGTHGRTGIQHLLLGSVAETVTRYAPCAVLVVQ